MKLRPYQLEAFGRIHAALKQHRSTLLVLPTGCGKTIVFCEVIRNFLERGVRTLVLAHRDELLGQARAKLAKFGITDVGVEKAAKRADGEPVVVASVQTLHGRRLRAYPPGTFGLIVVDECFPAGTQIDGRSIEQIRRGDLVQCVDHTTGRVVPRRVRRTFRSVPSALVEIHFTSGRRLVCTPGHPIFVTTKGYTPAGCLAAGQEVVRHEDFHLSRVRSEVSSPFREPELSADLLRSLQKEAPRPPTTEDTGRLHNVQSTCNSHGTAAAALREDRSGLLQRKVQARVSARTQREVHGANQSGTRIPAHESQQPHAPQGGARTDGQDAPRYRTWAEGARWQWPRANPGGAADGQDAGVANQRDRENEDASRLGLPEPLQDRRGQREAQDRGRDRRRQPLRSREEGAGPQEGRLPSLDWVASVSFHEPGCDGTFGGLCPDGHVYNLEVAEHHNYFANGYLVHNCHRSASPSYQAVTRHFADAKVLGVTATPDRLDGRPLGAVFDSVAYEYSIREAIRAGWLVPIRSQRVHVEGLDLARVRTTAGDLNVGDLAAQLTQEKQLHEVAAPLVDLAGDRPTVVFAADVAHARALAEVLNRYRPGAARSIDGSRDTTAAIRSATLEGFTRGEFQFLINCALLTEGWDEPRVGCVAIARPTKSRALFTQMVGRGTRLYPGKSDLLVLDFTGDACRHALVSTADVLAGQRLDDDLADAAELLARACDALGANAMDALEMAEAFIAADRRRAARSKARRAQTAQAEQQALAMEAARERVTAVAKYIAEEFDPFLPPENVEDVPADAPWANDPATERQIAYLRRKGVKVPDGVTAGAAARLIRRLVEREERGLCTFKQARWLKRHGVANAHRLSKDEASALIGQRMRTVRDQIYGTPAEWSARR